MNGKYYWLSEHDITTTPWIAVDPQALFYFFRPQNNDLLAEYGRGSKVTNIFLVKSVGLYTARDALAIHWGEEDLWNTITDFAALPSEDARSKYALGDDSRDWRVELAQRDLKGTGPSKSFIVPILYRPFDIRSTYYTGNSRGFLCMPRSDIMRHMLGGKNIGLITNRQVNNDFQHVFCSDKITNDCTVSSETKERSYLFPLYLYPDTKKASLFDTNLPSDSPGGRRPNLSPAFIADISGKLKMQFVADGKGDLQGTFGPEDVFDYMYAVFHSPTYRARYAEFLKIDFPRLPLTANVELFRELCRLGERLVVLHLMERYGKMLPRFPGKGDYMVEKVEYLEPRDAPESGRVYINKTQYFEGVPSEVWNFHVGGYQVCQKWLKDRKGRRLSFEDVQHYQRIVAALAETITLMEQVDEAIEEHGGWPIG